MFKKICIFVFGCGLIGAVAHASNKSTDTNTTVRKPSAAANCSLVQLRPPNSDMWEIRIGNVVYDRMGADRDTAKTAEIAKNLAQAGICQF